jgi:hypothetical protein
MKHYIQLKDGVVFSYHQSPDGVDDSGPNVWEVDSESSDKLGMNYNPDTKVFSEAEIIRYAILNEENVIVLINETKYSSDVKDNIIITNPEVDVLWQWDGESFINLIEKNNLEANEQYVKSLDDLAAEAAALANAIPEVVEEVTPVDTRTIINVDGVDVVFETQAEALEYINEQERQNELKMQELLKNGTFGEDDALAQE